MSISRLESDSPLHPRRDFCINPHVFCFPFLAFVSVGGEKASNRGFLRDPDGFDFNELNKLALTFQNLVVAFGAGSGARFFFFSLSVVFASSAMDPNKRA